MASAPDSPIAISLGDPAGIGPEVIAKCWDHRAEFDLPPFVAIGDGRSIAAVWDGPIEVVDDPSQADAAFDYALPLIQLSSADGDLPGHPSVAGAHCSLDALELAVGLARSGSAAAVVTGPVAKEQLYAIGFQHPGQTEFVAERCGISPANVVMMLAGPTLRTVPVTTHLPLRDVPDSLTASLIESRGRATLRGSGADRRRMWRGRQDRDGIPRRNRDAGQREDARPSGRAAADDAADAGRAGNPAVRITR